MKPTTKFSDERHDIECAFCGSFANTKEHIPSKVLLNNPFPPYLPTVPSCKSCNSSYSLDEEYFACAIECILAGSTNPNDLTKSNISAALRRNKTLRDSLSNQDEDNEGFSLQIDTQRFQRVIAKLAFCHYKYELSSSKYSEPQSIAFYPIHLLDDKNLHKFKRIIENPPLLPELGSRAFSKTFASGTQILHPQWQEVQKGNYEYYVYSDTVNTVVRMIIGDYLACEVIWSD